MQYNFHICAYFMIDFTFSKYEKILYRFAEFIKKIVMNKTLIENKIIY